MATPLTVIIGAGPTGMTAAIELKRAGLDVRIIDKSDHLAAHSQALIVQARTLEQMQRYGLADEAIARGRKLHGAQFYSEGRQILDFKFDRLASRYPFVLFLPQSETEALLNEHMESLGVKTERSVELETLSQDEDSVLVTLRHPDGNLEQVNARWVIGCDGAHSAVREKTGTPFEGEGIGLSFFLADLELDGPDAPGDDLAIHLSHGNVVFMGRLNDKLVRVIVALHEQQSEETHRDLTIEDFQRSVDKVGVRVQVRSSEWMTPFHVNDLQAKRYRIGNIFLAGDASHIHSPVGGQGMNTGIQDAANLAWKLAAIARGAQDAILDSYEQERGEVGKALLRFTERGLKMATTTSSLLEGLRDRLFPSLSKLAPVERAMTGFIAETAIEYRSSSVVSDRGGDGDLRAGDRLPDLTLQGREEGATLLRHWKNAEHLALLINASQDEENEIHLAMPHAQLVSLHTPDLDDQGVRLLGIEKKIVIVRPDGYVGFRGPIDRVLEWRAYARQDGLDDANLEDRKVA
jgi:2-polyprenyl-6-methoxyphenol hydroxylase-like FAD-dependent oxidoreductase